MVGSLTITSGTWADAGKLGLGASSGTATLLVNGGYLSTLSGTLGAQAAVWQL